MLDGTGDALDGILATLEDVTNPLFNRQNKAKKQFLYFFLLIIIKQLSDKKQIKIRFNVIFELFF